MDAPIVVCCENYKKSRSYVAALRAVGVDGRGIRAVTPSDPPDDPRRLARQASGVVICGGPDVAPWRYGEEPLAEAGLALYPELDDLECRIMEGARDARTPVWAICRGLQTVNVFLGGSLWQDLLIQVPGAADHKGGGPLDHLAHGLGRIDTSTAFGARLAGEPARVNTRHHQGIRELATPLSPVAYSPDGVLEVIELRDSGWWLRGVQWHPEDLVAIPLQRTLWTEFLEVTRGRGHHP